MTEPAAPLLGEEARRLVAAPLRELGYAAPVSLAAEVLRLLEPLVAALVAERERAEYERAYREVEEVARKVDPDLEGYSVRDLANNLRLMLEGRVEGDVSPHGGPRPQCRCGPLVDRSDCPVHTWGDPS